MTGFSANPAAAISAPVLAEREVALAGGPLIATSQLGRRFETAKGWVDAVRDVTMTVAPGEFVIIVGPSGCGKTTLLRIFAGLDHPTSGTLTMGQANAAPPRNAMVFQGRSVYPWLSVRDNVAYGLKLTGVGRKERKSQADALLKTVGLTRFADAYPHQISEGMRQRVAISRALAVDPDLLLMDEPFGALDEQTRFLIQEELLRIWEETGKTIVFVTHSIDEALTLADRILVMSAHPGTILAEIPVPLKRPRELATVRSDPKFASLFGDIWNLLRQEVAKSREPGEVLT